MMWAYVLSEADAIGVLLASGDAHGSGWTFSSPRCRVQPACRVDAHHHRFASQTNETHSCIWPPASSPVNRQSFPSSLNVNVSSLKYLTRHAGRFLRLLHRCLILPCHMFRFIARPHSLQSHLSCCAVVHQRLRAFRNAAEVRDTMS